MIPKSYTEEDLREKFKVLMFFNQLVSMIIYSLLGFFFLATPATCGSSQARAQNLNTAATQATIVSTQYP